MKWVEINLVLILVLSNSLHSQNLEKIGKKDALKINGSLNYNSILYNSQGIEARRDPFSWYFNGNINFSILDWSIPFSYSYSNQQGTFTQPFNQYGLMPQYKWFKGYAGYSSITFSPYTLSGYVFVGGAIELTPGNWKIASMYGRLNKAVAYDHVNENSDNMAYERWGRGLRCGYEKKGNGFYLNYFYAKDKISSLLFIPPDANLLPEENTVVSIEVKTGITKHFFAEAEYALSGITRNLQSEYEAERKNYLPGIFKIHSGSYFSDAFKTLLAYKRKIFSVTAGYERIAPDYQTLGTYYFNNDLENITITPSLRLFKEKLSLSVNTGMQRNNLDNTKLSTVRRWVGSANVALNINSRLMLAGSYSNFTTYTKLRPAEDPYYNNSIDTLNFYQLAQNGNFVINYIIKRSENSVQSLTSAITYLVSGEKNDMTVSIPSHVISSNMGYSLNMVKSKTVLVFSGNYNQANFLDDQRIFLGPGMSCSKAFGKTFKGLLGTTYNHVYSTGLTLGSLLNNRLSINWTPKVKNEKNGKPSLGVSLTDLYHFGSELKPSNNEITGMINVVYAF